MSLRVYNTLTCEKEAFVPLTPGKAGMYVCGVTVYDYCHIGHARANVVFDVIFRYLKHSGYDVTYVRNYTDIDDKIINRANQEGVDYRTIADRYIQSFDEDMARLGLELPTVQPKATEHIDGIIAIIQTLIDRGHAYASGEDVYFAVETFTPYLKLSGRNLDEMQAGARVEVGEKKRNPMDFVLWKGSKPGEPWWESPWGNGRPGWHIECSAMSMKYLGTTFDFHGGGKDLVFPHHENEIAQSEAANGCQFVRYWLHNGFVNINSEKMSKSLGNFFTIREVLERFDPETLRFFILSAHYRSPIDFSDQNLEESQAGLERIYTCLAGLNELAAALISTTGDSALPLHEECRETQEQAAAFSLRFREAMDDDFNTALALGVLFELVRSVNRCVAPMKEQPTPALKPLVDTLRNCFDEVRQVLGIITTEPKQWLEQARARHAGQQGIDPAEIERLIAERAAVRSAKNFKRSDEIRDLLLEQGIQLLDSPQGTTWKAR